MFGTRHYPVGLRGVGGGRLRAALLASTALVAAASFEGEFSSLTRSYAGKGVVRYAW